MRALRRQLLVQARTSLTLRCCLVLLFAQLCDGLVALRQQLLLKARSFLALRHQLLVHRGAALALHIHLGRRLRSLGQHFLLQARTSLALGCQRNARLVAQLLFHRGRALPLRAQRSLEHVQVAALGHVLGALRRQFLLQACASLALRACLVPLFPQLRLSRAALVSQLLFQRSTALALGVKC